MTQQHSVNKIFIIEVGNFLASKSLETLRNARGVKGTPDLKFVQCGREGGGRVFFP